MVFFERAAVGGEGAAGDDKLRAGAAGVAQLALDEAVQAHAGLLGRHRQDAHDGIVVDAVGALNAVAARAVPLFAAVHGGGLFGALAHGCF